MTAMAVDSVAAVLRGETPRTAVNPDAAGQSATAPAS